MKMILPFGKHKGEDIASVPMSYLWIIWEKNILRGELREAVRQRIEPERYRDAAVSMQGLAEMARRVLGRK